MARRKPWSFRSLKREGEGGQRKLSAVLLEFIEPFRPPGKTPEVMEPTVMLGKIAWNLAVMPEDLRSESLQKFAKALMGEGTLAHRVFRQECARRFGRPPEAADFESMLRYLVERKLEKYPNDRRFILSHEFRRDGDGVELLVASTPLLARPASTNEPQPGGPPPEPHDKG